MSTQFNKDDQRITSEFLGLLVNLGASPEQAYKQVNEVLKTWGWEFVYFNDIEDFWITTNDIK